MPATRQQKMYRVTLAGSIVNALLLILKFAAGIIGHSTAMIADAVHSLSDFITDIVVIAFVRLSSKPADKDHAYGHGKYETIATSIIGLALMAVAVKLGWDGIQKIFHVIRGGELQSPGIIALIAAITSIIAKEWIYQVTHRVARQLESQALEANAWHHRSDAFSSIGTAIGIGGAVILGSRWTILDPIAAVIVSIMISITALKLLRKSSGELLEESLPQETEQQIINIVYQDPLATDVHHLHTRRIGNIIAIEMHLRLPKDITLEQAHTHATAIERHLRDTFGSGTHIMLHIEPTKP